MALFDESADLYRDGSVVVVPLRGHTPGSVGVFVNLSPSRRLFYVGDSVDDEIGFERRVGKPLLLRDTDNDRWPIRSSAGLANCTKPCPGSPSFPPTAAAPTKNSSPPAR